MRRVKPSNYYFDRERVTTICIVVIIFALSFLLWCFASAQTLPWHERPLKLWMLNVGQGDSFLIELPGGEQFLIDGGPSDAVLSKLGAILPPWDRSLDAIIATHTDADHVGGLVSVLDRYEVATVYETGAGSHTPEALAFSSRVTSEGAVLRLLSHGDVISVGEAKFSVLWPDETLEGEYPEDRNDTSLVVLLEYYETSILLTGDSQTEVEEKIESRVGDVDVLKVGHHGSITSTGYDFLARTQPEVALISVGRDNTYGLPHPSIVSRLMDIGARIFRTDLDGDVLLLSNGGEPKVTSRPLPF
jgi:competence protein ComEC